MQPMKEEFIPCDCGLEVLRLTYDPDDLDFGLNVSILEKGGIPWRDKLRWIWQIIRHGSPFSDAILLNNDGVTKLIDFGREYHEKGEL